MSRSHIPLFFGDYRTGELPYQWLQIFEGEAFEARYDEAEKVSLFGLKMAEGDEAGDWWESMDGIIDKTNWKDIKTAFLLKWPKPNKGIRHAPHNHVHSLQHARATLFQNVKVDVNPPSIDNEKMIRAVSRSFICEISVANSPLRPDGILSPS